MSKRISREKDFFSREGAKGAMEEGQRAEDGGQKSEEPSPPSHRRGRSLS